MILVFYNLAMIVYAALVQLASIFNPRAKQLLNGWRNAENMQRAQIVHTMNAQNNFATVQENSDPNNTPTHQTQQTHEKNHPKGQIELIWIHCASLGEFEMAKPIAAALQAASNQRHILFSFFSPSGFNHAKLDTNQTKTYLPLDGANSARRWFAQWQPQAAIFIRYEFWYYYMKNTIANDIPAFALGVSFTPNHFIFSLPAAPWRNLLKKFNGIGFINQPMSELARLNHFRNAFVFGDPKFNRAFDRSQQPSQLNKDMHLWLKSKPTLILGSAWQPEIELLSQFIVQNPTTLSHWQILIAPHSIERNFTRSIPNQFPSLNSQFYSEFNPNNQAQLLILDSIGQLAECYRYGKISFVGGAFGKGLHNITEPAAFGLPIIFGPHFNKFPEASQFIQAGFGFSVANLHEFSEIVMLLVQQSKPHEPHPLAKVASQFVTMNRADISKFVKLTYPNTKFDSAI